MGKLDANKKAKRDSLLNTAFQLFTSKGINKTSISDIVENAGVAKGTFYLYFNDKIDIRNKLIAHKSGQIFGIAADALEKCEKTLSFEEKIIFIVDNILNQFIANESLLGFISKNLSWGVFKSALYAASDEDVNFHKIYNKMLEDAPYSFEEPEIMLFMIVELVSASSYSSILYNEPVSPDKLKPYLYRAIYGIIDSHKIVCSSGGGGGGGDAPAGNGGEAPAGNVTLK